MKPTPSAVRSSPTSRPRPLSLLWWVFLANGSVLVVALLLLTFSPIEIDSPIEGDQFALLLGGFLVLLALNVMLLRRVLSPLFRLTDVMSTIDPDTPGRRLSGVEPRSREGQALASALRPEALDDLGLVNALIALCNRVGAQDGTPVRRDLQGDLPPLSPDVELVIYRIAQEGLTNSVRHSGAGSVTLSLRADAETLNVRVADDGEGMPAQLPAGTAGLAGMRERALLVGGRLSIASRPGQGTEVGLTIPVEPGQS